MKKYYFIFIFLFLNIGCSVPPNPTPYPSSAKKEHFDILKVPLTNNVIANSLDPGGWDFWTVVVYDNNNLLKSLFFDELEFSYLLGNSDEIIIFGNKNIMDKTYNTLKFSNLNAKLTLSQKCIKENCEFLSLQLIKNKTKK